MAKTREVKRQMGKTFPLILQMRCNFRIIERAPRNQDQKEKKKKWVNNMHR